MRQQSSVLGRPGVPGPTAVSLGLADDPYQPDAPARGVRGNPRWRVGLVWPPDQPGVCEPKVNRCQRTNDHGPRTATLRLWAGLLATVWAQTPDCALAEERPSKPAIAARSGAAAHSGTGLEGEAPAAGKGVPRPSGLAGLAFGSKANRAGGSEGWGPGWAGIALALAVCGGLVTAVRRFRPAGAAGSVEVVGRVSLSPRHSVYLLRVGRRVLLVGAGPQGPPALISELDELPADPQRGEQP
jgi:hypothetical protein